MAYEADKPSMPLLTAFWVVFSLVFFRNTLQKLWNKIPFLSIAAFELDENLPNYFKVVDENDLKWSHFEEAYAREIMGLTTLDD